MRHEDDEHADAAEEVEPRITATLAGTVIVCDVLVRGDCVNGSGMSLHHFLVWDPSHWSAEVLYATPWSPGLPPVPQSGQEWRKFLMKYFGLFVVKTPVQVIHALLETVASR
ncbi:hypothetical protein [Breoghania sp.]|uniref:hypothetical protein n=1 Tax=Breoghania sp. TaxID=2065378 RepID=UPI00261EB638|nr:hypothetical protein [Breoghania sp.]MDJ0930045.1 hypothetical protein [Breoghania sp.]